MDQPPPPKIPDAAPPVISAPPSRPGKSGGFPKVLLIVVLALVVLIVGFVGMRAYQFVQWKKNHGSELGGMELFMAASKQIGPRGTIASGNNEQAQVLAAELSRAMTKIRVAEYSQAKEKALLDTQDEFKTYCELRSNECVFLIHVPELRRFTGEAQEALASEAWNTAQSVLVQKQAGNPGMKLAVGIVGLVLYERVMTGRQSENAERGKTAPENTVTGPDSQRVLYDWFSPPKTNSTSAETGAFEKVP